jgi:hypothetical protein
MSTTDAPWAFNALVEEKQRRVVRDGLRDLDELLHAPGERCGGIVHALHRHLRD